jgi:hypothetical protein
MGAFRSDTIRFRAVQPKRPYRVAKIGGGHRTFASVVAASEFAASQARASWTDKVWSVTHVPSGRMWLVDEAGDRVEP